MLHTSSYTQRFDRLRTLLLTALAALALATPPAMAQNAGQITIGGKVYGGGKEGAILSGNTTSDKTTAIEAVVIADQEFRTSDDAQASQVTINNGNIVGVFGGGEEGRAYGKTNVTVKDGIIGVTAQAAIDKLDEATKRVNGNVFGAGDGNAAAVFGGSDVTIIGGRINGSVYGGGNEADLIGCSELDLQGGVYVGAVFGGARKSNIYGYTFVNIDGLNAKNDLHIIDVYGGNDIAGEIHPDERWSWTRQSFLQVPFEIADATKAPYITTAPAAHVDNTWNAFILATEDQSANKFKTLIDNLYSGGNGDYDYTDAKYAGLSKPVIDRTYMQLEGGAYGSVYGGGNAATVAKSTDICLLNSSTVDASYLASLTGTPSERLYTADYQFNRVFGGNNKEPMAIRPNWYLEKATVNNLYSGGNAGPMTYHKPNTQNTSMDAGILIHVKSQDMVVHNVYGGCRMADVNPGMLDGSNEIALNAESIDGYDFPHGYSARVLIEGGKVYNVYGGNDVSGTVYYGSDVEIRSSIIGNVYGAGNGSYAYTDNAALKNHPLYGDFYYTIPAGKTSAEALNIHRPNASTSLVHIVGKSEAEPTYIGGGVYCGGNSATLRADVNHHESADKDLAGAVSNLKLGSHVIADKVFLGSNGENMVTEDMLKIYANQATGYPADYSSMDLTDHDQFEDYMRGVEVAIHPVVTFDQGYVPHSTKIGSLYGGGNVGSMTAPGTFQLQFLDLINIYSKLVGGCNNANVATSDYNAFHLGGLTNSTGLTNGKKVQLDIHGVQLEPRKLTYDADSNTFTFGWNYAEIAPARNMLIGANIYGGCYASGYINGGVDINITHNAIGDNVFTSGTTATGVTYDDVRDDVLASTLSCYGGGYGPETEIWGHVTIDITGDGRIMKAYGGGEQGVVGKLDRDADGLYGQELDPYEPTKPVQEWYSQTTGETLYGYNTFKTEYKSRDHYVAKFADGGKYNATVNLNATLLADNALNVAKLYGGGFQGTISGNTIVNLNKGRVYDAFGGASNADILGHTEMYVGKSSAPTVTHNVYGANDFGGLIVGHNTYHVDNNKDGDTSDTMEKIIAQSYVEYSAGNIAGDLFGGPCGAYNYSTDAHYADAIAAPNFCKPQLLKDFLTGAMLTPLSGAGYAANSFVNVISQSTLATDVIGGSIFGAGQGLKGSINLADERGSYVRLMSATKSQRSVGELSQRVYGAGFCSNTNRSLVDAYTGYYKTLFGGAHGITYQELTTMQLNNPAGHYETNYMGYRSAVRLHEMANNEMDIYGGGANAGADETGVVLNGGEARYIYGASYAQGISYASSVEVPETSISRVKAIFGGAEGGQDNYPCDAYNTFVTWKSSNARVQDAIYGGNNAFRMTRNAYLAISAPVKDYNDQLTNVFGGGYGPKTVTLYTSVGILEGGQVANVYGGGNNGQVLDTPSFRYYLDDGQMDCGDGTTKPDTDGKKTYPASLDITADTPESDKLYGYQKYLRDTEVIGFHRWIYDYCWDGHTLDDRDQPIGSYLSKEHGHAHPVYFLSTQQPGLKNTNVFIMKGALVAENAYGGGLGAQALVSGETSVHLMGGTVRGDIYGGGQEAHVEEYPHLIFPAGGQHELTISETNVDLQGGIARNVYGGGLKGRVTGSTNVTLGTKDQHEFDFYGTRVAGQHEHQTYYGDPIVERSLYGGGQMGPVHGTAYLTLNQGHVGYKYDASKEVDNNVTVNIDGTPTTVNIRSNKDCYVENLDLNDEGDNFLDQNGNVFGAGYGEGASVDVTYVNVYGGTVRNSLYGGGEIAAVGRATMTQTGAHPQVGSISVAGRTHVYMYKGLVQGDVFGGGRGYSYDLTGNEVIGKTLYTDGYVFGTTDVEIRGGIIGTPETVADGHGNVFGGGNIGYCFSDAAKHGTKGDHASGDGRYYTNAWKCTDTNCGFIDYCHNAPTVCGKCGKSPTATDPTFRTTFTQVGGDDAYLSEDCRVVISPYAQVKPGKTITIKGNNTTLPDGTVLTDKTFQAGEYVPTYYLDLLKDKNTDKSQWDLLDDAGVTIRNAVFAGGNVSAGSDKVYANAVTVFGNATASVNDVFFRDFVSIGTENIGGIYGDGNLTFVDGYRELNITDYGTDYYGQQDHITLAQYEAMNDRERAYFELEYQAKETHTYEWYSCNTAGTYGGTEYVRNQHIDAATYTSLSDTEKSNWTHHTKTYTPSNSDDRIKQTEWELMTTEEKDNWTMYGFCSIYAGRLLNTIQRADFCGVFGSRLVLEGAQDRVPEVVDYTQYTLNRVGELSLNKSTYKGTDTSGLDADHLNHGNYFGMYSIVNYLGAITSDVAFTDVRTTDNTNSGYKDAVNGKPYGTATFYDWKKAHQGDRKRNNGTCHNTVALAAGVYLELVNEPATAVSPEDRLDPMKKDYGYITGVVQLDLINVMQGLGGGYVYAKNEHGAPSGNPAAHENLSIYNLGAVNNSAYRYDESNRELVETSGNFIHNTKQIVDDCFPRGGDLNQPAHYWYIRGEFYVYDQYISAFTGSSTAYSENINLPLTITAGANGRLDLIDIKQNFYAYYKEEGNTPLTANEAFVVNNKTYGLNDVITWWDYMQLSDQQKLHFVPETLVATMDYSTTGNFDNDGKGEPVGVITKGEVILPTDPRLHDSTTYKFYDPEEYTTNAETGVKTMKLIAATDVFHTSNAVSHENGYVLAVSLDNPGAWDTWYSPESGAKKLDQATYKALPDGEKTDYRVGPTYYPTTSGVYGQHQHVIDEIVTKTVYDAYNSIPPADITALESAGKHQATVAAAYVAVTAATYDYDHDNNPATPAVPKNVQAGVGISATEYSALSDENKAKFSPAYTCTSTFEEDPESGLYVYFGELIPATRYQDLKNALVTKYTADGIADPAAAADLAMHDHFDNAYIVTTAGLYGGQHFNEGYNYRALDTWATLSAEDRQYFQFRYDALDALLLSTYPGTGEEGPGENNINLYDGPYWDWTGDSNSATPQHQAYGAKQPIDYTAKYEGSTALEWTDADGTDHTLTNADPALGREIYEGLPNEQRHYSAFTVSESDKVAGSFPQLYIVKESFISGGTHYAAGKFITPEIYASFDDERKAKIETFTPPSAGTYYICREGYTIGEKGMGVAVQDIENSADYTVGQTVPSGAIITASNYSQLVNKQAEHFVIHGNSPIETSTFYVNRESDINDLSKDRIVTVIYQYKYEESDESGLNIEEITERHIVNIHITFKSGVPTIGKLQEPSIVLPGQTVGLKSPNVSPGAYEILGGGWELFTNPEDAEKHQNGKTYVNNATPMYWYQDGYYVAYYAKTYLGKTYSNSVPFKVANYHDIADVMAHPEFMYIDNPNVKRNSKIYISDDVHDVVDTPAHDDVPAVTHRESEIDMLYSLFDKTLNKPENEKTVYVDVQRSDANGPLYYRTDAFGNKIEDEPFTNTPTPYPVTDPVPQQEQVINDHTRNCANLDFFLSDNVSTAKDGGWQPIGYEPGDVDPANHPDGECFMGTVHGMGYTISGLQKSLFGQLCGYVYNLGVTGTFTKSGVADRVKTATVPDSGVPGTQIHGFATNCWIITGADPDDVVADAGNPAKSYCPVVGTANDLSLGVPGIHVLNCYFPEECGYPMGTLSRGPNTTANSTTLRQFNNGEVTYDLNGFYLNKRYSDATVTEADYDALTGPMAFDKATYKYWTQQSNGDLAAEPSTGYYLGGGSMHAYRGENLGYVERLFADGDFVYKHGTIPLETNERYSTAYSRYLPVWPDDYYFFGQQLSYGYDEVNRPYQPVPSHARKTIAKDGIGHDERLVTTEQNNIVYRIPAYFRSSEKRWAHFNPHAIFADKMKEGYTTGSVVNDKVLDGREVHPGLTALDFSGFNDRAIMVDAGTDHQKFIGVDSKTGLGLPKLVFTNGARNIAGITGYSNTLDANGQPYDFSPLNDGAYFGPITDYTTIMSFETHGITQNLLTYAPTPTFSGGTSNTLDVLKAYYNEPVYADHYSADKYRKVEALDPSVISGIHGHLIQKENKAGLSRHYYYAASDHYLVDKQDFNAPIEYEFNKASVSNKEYRMWYQRTPEHYAGVDAETGKTIGWEGVSLPFGAELVTTQDKGEITHFYKNRVNPDEYNDFYDSGHEYWLREFQGVDTKGTGTALDPAVTTAFMNYPTGVLDAPAKEVANTFLWDYYYNADGKDANSDDYRHDVDNDGNAEQDLSRYYYGQPRVFEEYPLSEAGKPYIVGFPGSRYYEFDLSGTFVPQHTSDPAPAKLDPQVITFVSDNGITIRVSDDELAYEGAGTITHDGYTFYSNYLNIESAAAISDVQTYYQNAAEYNAANGTTLTKEEFLNLSSGEKQKATEDFNYYVLNGEGSSFDITETPQPIAPFRPYFTTERQQFKEPGAPTAPSVRRIAFSMGGDTQFEPDEEVLGDLVGHGLNIYAKKHKIVVESTLDVPRAVRITTAAGQVITTFTINPGERVATPVSEGIYITNLKKLIVD